MTHLRQRMLDELQRRNLSLHTVRSYIAWVPFFPLGGAMPGMPKVTDQPQVIDIASQLGTTPSQLGLAWMLRNRANTWLIPRTTDLSHLEQNLAAGFLVLETFAAE